MKKRSRVFAIPSPIEWVEPPVTKEEALNPDVAGTFKPDGFEGGHDENRHRGQNKGWKAGGLPWVQD